MFDSLQNITAELILISDSILFGSQDSLKFFLLSNGDSIILSKNNGILKFPSYYAYNNPLHDTSYTFNSTADKHTLIGKENETIGKQIPQKNDFFNYETNDILQYYIVDGDYGFHYTSEQRILKTITIIDNISNNNEEMYTADIHEFSYKYWVDYMFIDHFIDSMEISYQDTLFCRPSKYNLDSYTGQNNYYSLDTNRQYYSSKVSYNNHFKGIMKSYNDDLYALYYNLNSMSFEIVNSNIHLTNTSHFVENIGLVEKHYGFNDETPQESSSINTSLMGFVHNGDTIGSIDFPLFAPSLDYLPNLKVYPNPTNDIVYIQFGNTKSMDCIIQLRDQLGRVLKSEEYINIYSDKTYSLDLSHYHSGFYILEIRNIKGNQVNSWKVMKR